MLIINEIIISIKNLGNLIRIQHIGVFIDLLRNFGKILFEILIIFEDISEHDGRQMLKLINQECSKTLKQLDLKEYNGSILNELTNQFPRVKTLTLTTSKTGGIQFLDKAIKLSNIFLNVEIFTLNHLKDSEWKFLGKFPLLYQINLILPKLKNQHNFDESHIEDFLKQNEDIYYIVIDFMTLKILQTISKCTPNLENLELHYFAQNFINVKLVEGEFIRFDTVKDLTIRSDQVLDKMHENVIFDELDALILYLDEDFNENWLTFIEKQVNKHLNEITIEARTVEREHFFAIADKLPNIRRACVHTSTLYKADDFVQFFKRNGNLDEFHVLCAMTENDFELLYEVLPEISYNLDGFYNPVAQTADITVGK